MVAYSFKKQFIGPILAGLDGDVALDYCHPKRQTIRAVGRRRHARPGETIQIYTAMRTKQCRKLGEACCKSVEPIRIFVHANRIEVGGELLRGGELDDFARSDGFPDWLNMRGFWCREHDLKHIGPFVGVLIKWEVANG